MNRCVSVLCSLLMAASISAAKDLSATREAREIAHGKYLVDHVSMCGDCHSPRNEKGAMVPGRYLEGARLEFQPIHPIPGFVAVAPPIAGLPGLTRAAAVQLLMTGLTEDNKRLAPPMPQFHLSRRDAEAVVDYLKSLHPESK